MPPDDSRRQDGSGQGGRWFDLSTPLGKDALIVTEMVGEEGVSRLYRFDLTVVSEKQSIAPDDLLGKVVTLDIGCYRGGPASGFDSRRAPPEPDRRSRADSGSGGGSEPARRLNGIVTRFRAGRYLQNKLREYRIEISPKLWVTQRSSRYRVYQNKTAKDIILQLLDDASVKYKNNLTQTYDQREYCVQYGETDFDFLTRLMCEEGIFYYFTHASGEHTLVLEDSKTWSSGDAKLTAPYNPGDTQFYDVVNAFEFGPGLIDCEYLATDYDFEAPDSDISDQTKTTKAVSKDQSWKHQVHGAGLTTKASAKKVSKIDVESAEAGYETGAGRGTVPHFVPGLVFELGNYGSAVQDEGRDDRRSVDDDRSRGTSAGSSGGNQKKFVLTEVTHDGIEPSRYTQPTDAPKRAPYRNTFACMPSEVPLPRPVPPQKPLARGPMTALVVGPSGSEIHTDKYGRIRVQFYWDRDGKKDDKSSCFIRVAQPWSGKNWGAVFIPRVGMEVVVQFVDGDPDRPLVTGTVYNGTNLPPWTLPDKMTKSGFLTRSTKSGAVADANELSFDDDKGKELFLIHAQRDLTREVENDEKITVGHDQTTEVENDRTTTVKTGNDTLTVKTGNQTHEVSTGNRSHTIKTGNDTLEVSTGNRSVTVKTGNHDLTLNLGNASTTCSVGKIALTAAQSVKLTCGPNTLELTPSGITLNGIMISLKASAMLEEKAPMISVKADGMAMIEGGLVKIN